MNKIKGFFGDVMVFPSEEKLKKCWTLYFDGAVEPVNPGGNATYGWVLETPDKSIFAKDNGFICRGPGATNNVAEMVALQSGLEFFTEEEIEGSLRILGDSQLVVNTVSGKWRCHKDHLKKILAKIKPLLFQVEKWEISWIPREKNFVADRLSKTAKVPPYFEYEVRKAEKTVIQKKNRFLSEIER